MKLTERKPGIYINVKWLDARHLKIYAGILAVLLIDNFSEEIFNVHSLTDTIYDTLENI